MDFELINNLRMGAIYYIILLCSLCIHEWAHAFLADKLGDPLPRAQGRVTLNPLSHIDLLGTVIFPLIMIFTPILSQSGPGLTLIGWGRPVLLSLPNPKTRLRDEVLISLAGPFSNLALCALASILMSLISGSSPSFIPLFHIMIFMNAALFVFNMLPIPPLDGSHLLKALTGMREETFYKFSQWGFLLLLLLINLPPFRLFIMSLIASTAGFFIGLFDASPILH